MDIYGYEDYVKYLGDRIDSSPQKRGELKDLAKAVQIHPSHISQVMSGKRHLTPDQALSVARHLGLDANGRDYFLNLVSLARAESPELREVLRNRLNELRAQDQSKMTESELSPQARIELFISNWYYCAIRVLTSVKGTQTVDTLAHHLKLPREIVADGLRTLVELGFCQRNGEIYSNFPALIDLSNQPHLLLRHRMNWRYKASERLTKPISDNERYMTFVTAISKENEERISKLVAEIDRVCSENVSSGGEPEVVRCLNIDWFKV